MCADVGGGSDVCTATFTHSGMVVSGTVGTVGTVVSGIVVSGGT